MIKTYLLSPIQKFVKIESFSGLLLFAAAILAMIWANSAFSDSYQSLWQFEVGIGSAEFGLTKPLILWINDGLMAIFFFLIGLEIKRELLLGELNSVRKTALPLFAATGGILLPLTVFLILNNNPETTNGWGIPMATDVAFSLAILKLLGKYVPLSIKIFLTAFAIVDDLGSVMVIALYYSGGVDWMLILYSIILLAFLFYLSYQGFYSKYLTFGLGILIWVLFLKSGIHPTIAGVLLAFTIPIRQKLTTPDFIDNLTNIAARIANVNRSKDPVLTKEQIAEIDNLENLIDEYQSPLQHLEHQLHSWVAYFVMPVFALANAGVVFSSDMPLETALIVNIAISLFIGKLIGISFFSYLAVRLKLAELPEDVSFFQIIGVAILAGVGFTMSIFIANLAFSSDPIFIDSAKIGIIAGSLISGLVGALILRFSGRKYVTT